MRDVDWADLRFFLAVSERGVSRTRLAPNKDCQREDRREVKIGTRGHAFLSGGTGTRNALVVIRQPGRLPAGGPSPLVVRDRPSPKWGRARLLERLVVRDRNVL
jgi:hypothetical protein